MRVRLSSRGAATLACLLAASSACLHRPARAQQSQPPATTRIAPVFEAAAAPAAPPPSAASSADANAILQRFKAVTGGAAWDSVRTLHTKYAVENGGLKGTSEEWDDILTGRTVSYDQMGGSRSSNGYDGTHAWHQSDTGPAQPDDGAAEQQDAVSDAYDTSNSFWYANRLRGKLISLGQMKNAEGASFEVVRVEPQNGTAYQMWFDPATGLLAKTYQQSALQTSITSYADWRPIPGSGGILVPYSMTQSDGDARYDSSLQITSVEVNADPPADVYAMPAQYTPDFSFAHNADSVTVPFDYVQDHIFVPIKINGHPESAMFDTGGAYIVSTSVARMLGMKPQGKFEIGGNGSSSVNGGVARADTVEIGGLTIKKPLFTTIPYFVGEGAEPIIGAELLERFVVAIDFDTDQITFTRPDAFHYTGDGAVVPFRLHDGHMPVVDGSVDEIPGTFTIDTGDNLALTLNGPFSQTHDLIDRYHPKFAAISGYGIGGADPAYVIRTHTLTLGGVTVHDRVTYLRGGKTGAGADRLVSGNVGNGVLRQFNLIFDYPRERIIFEKSKSYGDADVYMRSGIVFDITSAAPTIADVVPGSPAADAGLAPGDTILSINGVSAQTPSFGRQFEQFNYKPAGTAVSMQVMLPTGQTKSVTMVLRDLV